MRERRVKRRERHQQLWAAVFDGLRAEGMLREDVDVALCRVFVLGCINSVQTWFDPKKPLEKVADQLSTMFFEGVKPAAGAKPAAKAKRSTRKSELVA